MTATVTFSDAEQATWFAEMTLFLANGFHPDAEGAAVTMSDAARRYLAAAVHDGSITDEDDGFYDGTNVWIGGTAYKVSRA